MKFTPDRIAAHMQPITGSAIREIFHLLGKPGMISFAGGNPSNAALEPEVIADLSQAVLKRYGTKLLQYGATEGFYPLRESIAGFLKSAGVAAGADDVLPTQGSQQALDLLLKSLIEPGDVILVESPTFLGAMQAMRTYGARLESVPTDGEGIIVEAAERAIREHNPKILYVIPTFQNPSGTTLALDRRRALAKLAEKYGVVIAEDDPYRDLRFSGEPLPAIKSFDEGGWVVYMASFSKYVAPGLRVGAAVANGELIKKMIIGKQSVDVHSPLLTQAIIDEYIRRGELIPHINRIAVDYKVQLDTMLGAFKYFPDSVKYTRPEGGLFVWVELPEGADAGAMLGRAVEANVAYVPGEHFYHADGRKNTLRLNFSNGEPEVIESGMRTLGGIISELI